MEVTGVCPAGFPHSDICGSKPTCGSPQLFAAGRVLRRQMVPWHPPCALLCLISTPETILLCLRLLCLPNFTLPNSAFRLPSSAFRPQASHLRLVFQKNSFYLQCAVVKVRGFRFHKSLQGFHPVVGRNGLEPSTSRLSGECSNQLS